MNCEVRIPLDSGALVLKNPLMPAAGAFGNAIEFAPYTDLRRLGAILPNSFNPQAGEPSAHPKYCRTRHGFISSFAKNNIALETFAADILHRLPHRETPVIVNLKSPDMEHMARLAQAACACDGIAGVEVNLSCPYGVPGATPYWKDPANVVKMVEMVKQAAGGKAVFVKVPTADTPIEEMVGAAEQGGAHAFVTYNGIGGCGIDIRTRKYVCGAGGAGGYSGPGVKPYALNQCRRAAGAANIPVIGAGGICCAEDVVEYVMAGASAVQVGSANLTRPDFMARLLDDLDTLLQQLGVRDINEIRGCARV